MRSIFFTLLLVAALVVGGIVPISAAQEADDLPDDPRETTTAPTEPAHERIDNYTQLVKARLDDGTALLVLKSEKTQRITVTDAGAMMAGGNIPQKQFILKGGEKTTVRMDVHTDGGFAGVTIATSETLWGIPLEDKYEFLPGGPRTSDVQLAGLTGLLTTGLLAIGIAFKRRRNIGDDVERVL